MKGELPEEETRNSRRRRRKNKSRSRKIWPARVVIRKMQISVRMRHLPFIRLASDKKFYNIKFWQSGRPTNIGFVEMQIDAIF